MHVHVRESGHQPLPSPVYDTHLARVDAGRGADGFDPTVTYHDGLVIEDHLAVHRHDAHVCDGDETLGSHPRSLWCDPRPRPLTRYGLLTRRFLKEVRLATLHCDRAGGHISLLCLEGGQNLLLLASGDLEVVERATELAEDHFVKNFGSDVEFEMRVAEAFAGVFKRPARHRRRPERTQKLQAWKAL